MKSLDTPGVFHLLTHAVLLASFAQLSHGQDAKSHPSSPTDSTEGNNKNGNDNGNDDRRAECMMWSKLENKTLPLQNQGHANCTTNAQCTGFDCIGLYQGKELSFGMRVLPCQKVPGVEIYGYAPQFNAKNFTHVFTHRSQYEVPGALLNLSMIPGTSQMGDQVITGRLEVHIQRNPGGKSLMMGLIAQGCINNTCIFQKPVFNHTEIPVPNCPEPVSTVIKANSVCSMSDLDVCGPHQICVQEGQDNELGLCECRTGFMHMPDGTCESRKDDDDTDTEVIRSSQTSENANEKVQIAGSGSGNASSQPSNGGALVLSLISIGLVLVLVGVAVFVVLRTRAVPRLRARLTNTPYEDIVIGQQGRSESTQNVIA